MTVFDPAELLVARRASGNQRWASVHPSRRSSLRDGAILIRASTHAADVGDVALNFPVIVRWSWLGPSDAGWDAIRCLYVYVDPSDDLLYIGKADGCTVRERLHAPDKRSLLGFFSRKLALSDFDVFLGDVSLPAGCRLSRELLTDIESLLIYYLQPPGNIQSVRSRIPRPGLRVRCIGDWPYAEDRFVDPRGR